MYFLRVKRPIMKGEYNGMLFHRLDYLRELFIFIPFITKWVSSFVTSCWPKQSEGQQKGDKRAHSFSDIVNKNMQREGKQG